VRERKRENKEKQKRAKKEKWRARPGLSSCLERPWLAFYPDKDKNAQARDEEEAGAAVWEQGQQLVQRASNRAAVEDPEELSDDYKMEIDLGSNTGAHSHDSGSSDRTPIITPRAHQRHRMSQEGDAPINVTEEDIDDYVADCGKEPPPHGDDAALGKMQAHWHGVLGPDGLIMMNEAQAIEKMGPKNHKGKETDPKNIKVQETSADPPLEDLRLFAHRSENLRCINCQTVVQHSFLVIPSLEGLDKRSCKGQTGQFFGKVYGTCPLCAWREDKKNHLPSCECDFCKDKIFHYEAEVCELVCRSRPIKDSFWKKHKKSAEGHWKLRAMALRDKGVAPLRTPILLLSPNLPTSPLAPPPLSLHSSPLTHLPTS